MVTIEIDSERGPMQVTVPNYTWSATEGVEAWAEFLNSLAISSAGPMGASVDPDITAAGEAIQLLNRFGTTAKIVSTDVQSTTEEDSVAGRVY